jgi:hypothetical protein
MMKRYGDEADIESAIRAEELAEAGDRAGPQRHVFCRQRVPTGLGGSSQRSFDP